MKRNMELVRQILLEVEAADFTDPNNYWEPSGPIEAMHARIVAEAGLLDAHFPYGNKQHSQSLTIHVYGLTWDGHDFLDTVRDEGTWKKVALTLGSRFATASMEIIKHVAAELAKQAVDAAMKGRT